MGFEKSKLICKRKKVYKINLANEVISYFCYVDVKSVVRSNGFAKSNKLSTPQ